MRALRVSVVLVTIAALLVLIYYTVLELLGVWRELTTLSYMPVSAYNEQSAYMLLVLSIWSSVLVILLLVAITAVLHFISRVV